MQFLWTERHMKRMKLTLVTIRSRGVSFLRMKQKEKAQQMKKKETQQMMSWPADHLGLPQM